MGSGGVGECRCEALQSPAEQSEAIPIGMASTILQTNGIKIIHGEGHEGKGY